MTNEEFQRAKAAGLAQRVLRENAAASFIHNWFKDEPLFKQAAQQQLQSDSPMAWVCEEFCPDRSTKNCAACSANPANR